MSKMFRSITRTWNPFVGCGFACSYCWARRLAEGKLKKSYPNGFVPEFHPERLKVKFKPGEFVFVCSMGDISFCSDDQLQAILDVIPQNPDVKFLFQTKNPGVFAKILTRANTYFGCTIETNRPTTQLFSKAPETKLRYAIMSSLISDFDKPVHKFLAIRQTVRKE